MIEIFANNAQTTIAGGISSAATSVTLLSGTGALFPNPSAGQYFVMTFNDTLTGLVFEDVWVTARSGDVCTILRAQEGSTAVPWVSGDKVYCGPTAGTMAIMGQQQQIQQNIFKYAADTGSANAYNVALTPATLTTPVPGAIIYFLAGHANTGASTIVVNGSSAYPLLGMGRVALQGGEINKFCAVTYDAALSSYILLWSSGGAVQVPNATQNLHAVNLAQAKSTFALLAGSASQPFSASQIITTVMQGGTGAISLAANTGVNVVNSAGSAFVPINVGAAVNGQAAVNLAQANAAYAPIVGSYANNFQAANYLLDGGGVIQESGGPLLLLSNQYVGALNLAENAYVPVYCANPPNGQAAVNLGFAQANFAGIVGSTVESFQLVNILMYGNSLIVESGSELFLQANGGVNVVNVGNSAFQPIQCAPGSSAAQVTTVGQFAFVRGEPGYALSPQGFIIQWGQVQAGSPSQITFPLQFPNACLSVVACEGGASAPGTWNAARPSVHGVSNFTPAGYIAWGEIWNGSGFNGGTFTQNFIAVGF